MNLSSYAFLVPPPDSRQIKAVVVTFHGLGYDKMRDRPEIDELELAQSGALCIFPYCGPWSWMNRQARNLVDEIIENAFAQYGLNDAVPLLLRGGSMGGHSALVYAYYARKTPAAVACNCPVADPAYHCLERPDLPRTFQCAYGAQGTTLEEAFQEASPIELVDRLPRIPYLIIHGSADKAVNKAAHSDRLVEKMCLSGHDVEYIEAPGMGHTAFNDFTVYRRYQDFLLELISEY